MLLKFTDGFESFKDGLYERVNDGVPFDVDDRVGIDLLAHLSGAFEEAVSVQPVSIAAMKESGPKRSKR